MHNIVAIAESQHTYLAHFTGSVLSTIFERGPFVIGASTNQPGALQHLLSFQPSAWSSSEHISTYVGRVWNLELADHLKRRIGLHGPVIRFELFVAWHQHLYWVQHLSQKRFSTSSAAVLGATQFGANVDRCDEALAVTEGEHVVFRLTAALAAGAPDADADDIISGRRKLTVAVA